MRYRLILIFLIFTINNLLAQESSDSIKVFFIGHVPKGEKFKVLYKGDILLKFKSNGGYKHEFKVPSESFKKYGDPLNIFVLRKSFFCFFYRDTGLNAYYEPGFRYLVIIRDNQLKAKYAVRYEWTNAEPFIHHLKQKSPQSE